MTLPVWVTLLGIALATFAGTALQRIAGMGLGLIAVPALSVMLGRSPVRWWSMSWLR